MKKNSLDIVTDFYLELQGKYLNDQTSCKDSLSHQNHCKQFDKDGSLKANILYYPWNFLKLKENKSMLIKQRKLEFQTINHEEI